MRNACNKVSKILGVPFKEFKHVDSPCLKETVKVKSNLEFNRYELRMFLCYWYLLSII